MREFGEQKFPRHSIRAASREVGKNTAALNLAAAIIEAAVADWRKLIKKKKFDVHYGSFTSFDELRRFFKSDWCAFLLQYFSITPDRILAKLEEELQDSLQADAGKTKEPKRRHKKRVV